MATRATRPAKAKAAPAPAPRSPVTPCPACRAPAAAVRATRADACQEAAGRRFVALLPAVACSACGVTTFAPADLARLRWGAALCIARHGELSGEGLRFLRETLEVSRDDLAALLDVRPEALAHWEDGVARVPRMAFVLVGMVVEEAAHVPRTSPIRALWAFERPFGAAEVRIHESALEPLAGAGLERSVPGRAAWANAPCWCGSGIKLKTCHGRAALPKSGG